jgi:arylsulfatase A-like enzyme
VNLRRAVLLGLLGVVGCAAPPPMEEVDLVVERPPDETLRVLTAAGSGDPEFAAMLTSGWHRPAIDEADSGFVWSQGAEAALEFVVLRPGGVRLVLEGHRFNTPDRRPLAVDVMVNGTPVAPIDAPATWGEMVVDVPAAAVVHGRNLVDLHFDWAQSPRDLGMGPDRRRLALALRRVAVEGPVAGSVSVDTGGLLVDSGRELQWFLQLAPGSTLVLNAASEPAPDCRLLAGVATAAGRTSLDLAVGRPVQLPVSAAGPAMVAVSVDGPAACRFRLDELVLRRPVPEEPQPPQTTAPESRPMNVLIYLVDTLRPDRLSTYGAAREVDPRLRAFAEHALVFEEAWAPSSWTRSSVASLLTGLDPRRHAANDRQDVLPAMAETLQERLSDAGWQTHAVIANPNVGSAFGFDQGWHGFVELAPEDRRSPTVHEATVEVLDQLEPERPFFLYVHTVDPHLPYDPLPEDRERWAAGVEDPNLGSTEALGALNARSFPDEDRYAAPLLDLYDAEIAGNDRQFGRLLDELERRGVADDTIVVFVSDHGEEFFDHGEWLHGRSLWREVLRVPLLVRIPGGPTGRVHTPVGLVDVMPTLGEALDVAMPGGLDGVPFRLAHAERILGGYLRLDQFGGRSAVRGSHHAVQWDRRGYTSPVRLFDMAADPGETRDRAPDDPALGPWLLARDGRWVDTRPALVGGTATIDPETEAQLRALGYLGSP